MGIANTLGGFLIVLGVLIFVHELGHFLVARWFGVRVLTFSLGFGPKILKRKRGDTVYCISAIPLGGYVKMAGETTQDERSGAPDEFLSKPKWVRFLVYLAGPAMNIVLAVGALTIVLANGADVAKYESSPPVIGMVIEDSVAAKAGIQPGDLIVAVNGTAVGTWENLTMAILPKAHQQLAVEIERQGQRQTIQLTPIGETKYEFGSIGVMPTLRPQILEAYANRPAANGGLKKGDVILALNGQRGLNRDGLIGQIRKSANTPITFEIEREGKTELVTVTPEGSAGDAKIGAAISNAEVVHVDPTLPQAFMLSLNQNWENTKMIGSTLKGLFTRETRVGQLMGPVAIAELSGNAVELGFLALLGLMAMISLNLALLNLMPIPVLDGGQMAILILEGLFRRDISLRLKEAFAIAGALVIVALMVTVLYNDIARLVG